MSPHLGLQRIMVPSAQVSSLTTGSITLPSARGAFFEPILAYDSIATQTGGSTTISFTSIPGTYKHLELRAYARTTATSTGAIDGFMTFNSVTSNYNWHEVAGYSNTVTNAGAGINTTQINFMRNCVPRASETGYGMAVCTIYDYTSSNYKSIYARTGYGHNTGGLVSLTSGSSTLTSAITRIDLTIEGGATWTSDSTFELFGIKG